MYRDEFNEAQREFYWSVPRIAAAIIAMLAMMYGLGFLATGGDLAIYKFWAPKQADAQREVFEHTQSYIEGKRGNIARMRLEYETADPAHKAALRTMILSEADSVDISKLPATQQAFISSLRGEL
jgi:hypothetical protein